MDIPSIETGQICSKDWQSMKLRRGKKEPVSRRQNTLGRPPMFESLVFQKPPSDEQTTVASVLVVTSMMQVSRQNILP